MELSRAYLIDVQRVALLSSLVTQPADPSCYTTTSDGLGATVELVPHDVNPESISGSPISPTTVAGSPPDWLSGKMGRNSIG
jgi:hypothetical protein